MVKAIVYHSNTGHTLAYAKILGTNLKLPYYSIKEAESFLKKDDEIIYLSWICAGRITKLKKVEQKYHVKYIGAVGAYPKTEKYLEELKLGNQINKPFFYLRGGIDYSKLNGVKKRVVKIVGKTVPKEDKELSALFKNGGNFVKEENLEELIEFIKSEKKK